MRRLVYIGTLATAWTVAFAGLVSALDHLLGDRWPSRLVATAAKDRLKRSRVSSQNENPAPSVVTLKGLSGGVSGTLRCGRHEGYYEGSIQKTPGRA